MRNKFLSEHTPSAHDLAIRRRQQRRPIPVTPDQPPDDDYDFSTMQASKTNFPPISAYIDPESLRPKPDYGPTDVHDLQLHLGNAYATLPVDTFPVGIGLAHLVDPLDRLMSRSNTPAKLSDGSANPSYKAPDDYLPPKPVYDTSVLTDNHKRFIYQTDLQRHNECAHYRLEGLRTINTVLPGSLNSSMTPGLRDCYPLSFTIQDAFQTALTNVSGDGEPEAQYHKLVRAAMDHEVTMEQLAASKYFTHLRFLQSSIKNMDLDDHDFTDGQLISAATLAFQRSAFDAASITSIHTEWMRLDSVEKSTNPGTYTSTKLTRFMAHYEKCTNALWHRRCHGRTSDVANAATQNLSSRLDDLQERFDEMNAAPATIDMNDFLQQFAAMAQKSGYSPGGASNAPGNGAASGAGNDTSNGTASGAGTRTPAARPFNSPHHTEWKQWKFNCYTCGVNLTHDTRDHGNRRPRKAPDHDAHHTATFQDQQGGNAKKNRLWLKWYNPYTGKAHDSINGPLSNL